MIAADVPTDMYVWRTHSGRVQLKVGVMVNEYGFGWDFDLNLCVLIVVVLYIDQG
jgi:hypothetical protein